MDHCCIKIVQRDTDYVKGVSSPILFASIAEDWSEHLKFFERQKIGWETNGCVLFTAQESFDSQMDALWPTFSPELQKQITNLGFLDTGIDGNLHFHSSPRFLQVLTGNGFNGNSLQDAWDVMRKYGVLPWRDLPYDETIPQSEYLSPIPQTMLDKAQKFLFLIGGKSSIQYHFVNQGTEDIPAMKSALPQAPLCIGIAVNISCWNQVVPCIASGNPGHSIMEYGFDTSNDALTLDHYNPFEKVIKVGYPILYALQGIVHPMTNVPIPPLPPLPANPTIPQELSWLDRAAEWLNLIIDYLKGRTLLGTTMNNYSILRSRTFWTVLIVFVYNGLVATQSLLPLWVSGIVNILGLILSTYFHINPSQQYNSPKS